MPLILSQQEGQYYNFLFNSTDAKYTINDQGRTPNYNSMGISAEYLPSLGKKNTKTFIVLFVSATNVLGQKANIWIQLFL
jgi:hypothetical protein